MVGVIQRKPKRAGLSVEGQCGRRNAQLLEQGVGGGQRRVAAERRLDGRRHPAQAEPGGIVCAQQKSRLGLIVLRRQGLHPAGIRPGVERLDHAGGVALEGGRGKGVDGPLAHAVDPRQSKSMSDQFRILICWSIHILSR